jgi:5-methylcytosine-specific restriction endonuclease McrA
MVFVIDKHQKPLMPCTEKRARLLLERGRARLHRRYPFTIRIVDRKQSDSALQPVRIKLDPGSKTTGIAVMREDTKKQETTVLWLAELEHRGKKISQKLTARRAYRRRRRNQLRYRPARFNNRTKPQGWLPPSLQHRVDTTMSWVQRLRRWAPVTGIAQELVKFDTQRMQNPEIQGVEYQQGTLQGYEVREYLLKKWNRACAYCGCTDVPLQIEHIIPKARGGSDRVSNLALACDPCNKAKNTRPIEEFLKDQPALLREIKAHMKRPLRDAAAMNATRNALHQSLVATGLPVETATGGQTKYNRMRLGIPKTHALDAACVGAVERLNDWQVPMLAIKAMGRGAYQRTRVNKYGFPRGYMMRSKRIRGFQTGDMVRSIIPRGKHQGTHVGRVAVRVTGTFNVQTGKAVIQGINHKYCQLLAHADGYGYSRKEGGDAFTRLNVQDGVVTEEEFEI